MCGQDLNIESICSQHFGFDHLHQQKLYQKSVFLQRLYDSMWFSSRASFLRVTEHVREIHFPIAHIKTNGGSPDLHRCETDPVWPGRWQEHQCRRPQARSWLGAGSLNLRHTARDSEISEESGLKYVSNSNQRGDIFEEMGSKVTTTNFNLSTTTTLWRILPLLLLTLQLHLFKIKLVAYYL